MARTTRTPLQRPPIDADELAEIGHDLGLMADHVEAAIQARDFHAAGGELADIRRILALFGPASQGGKMRRKSPPHDACLDDAGKALDARLMHNEGPAIKLSDPMRDYLSRSAAELVEATCHPDDVIGLGPGVLLPGDGVPRVCPTAAAELSNRDDALGRLHDQLTGHVLVPTCPCHQDSSFHQRETREAKESTRETRESAQRLAVLRNWAETKRIFHVESMAEFLDLTTAEHDRRAAEEMADQVAAVAFPDDDLDGLDSLGG